MNNVSISEKFLVQLHPNSSPKLGEVPKGRRGL